MTRILLLILFIVQCCASPAGAETPPAQSAANSYPGLSQVIPRSSQLTDQMNSAQQQLEQLLVTAPLQALLKQEQSRHAVLQQRISSYGPVESWYFDRQIEVSSQLKALDSSLSDIQQQISKKLQIIDQLRIDWQQQKDYWENWQAELQKAETKPPLDTFQRAQQQIEAILELTRSNNRPLVELQKQVSVLQESIQEQIGALETVLKQLRGNLLQRSGHSLFSAAYWQQFTPELWQMAQQDALLSLKVQADFYSRNATLIGIQILCALTISGLIYRYSSVIAKSSRWQILTDHAWATGLFSAIALLSFFYDGMPPLFRLILTSLGLLAAVRLSIDLLKTRTISLYIYSFALLAVVSLTFRLAGLPLPYYRVYLVGLCLVFLGMLRLLHHEIKAAGKSRAAFFIRLAVGLSLAALLTNLTGYVALTFRLLESSIESVVVILFAALAYQVCLGGLVFLLSRFAAKKSALAAHFGSEFQARIERIFGLILISYSCLYLSAVWGIYSSPGSAWDAVTGYSITIASYPISLSVIFQVVLVFYLSLELSWLLQAFLDRHLFDRRQSDRGVRDAVKKLLHYILVLIGFLLALGVAGFELQNLMVLVGAFGIGIGFGLQDIVNNFLSGIILLFERPIKVGDGVLIDGDYGTVLRIGLRSTVVETLDQAELIVPNSQMISQKVTNWTLSTRRVRLVVPVGVAYGSNLELVMQILYAAAEEHPDSLKEPKPSPIFVQFGSSSLDFELRVWISDIDKRPRVKSELLLSIDRRFRVAGVEIPFPQQDLHLRSVSPGIIPTLPQGPD